MNPTAWLEKTAPGFAQLSGPEREAITDFCLLWTLYEGRVLGSSGSAAAIICAVHSLKSRGRLLLDPFRPAIEHFIGRYFDDSDLTEAFRGLLLRGNDHRELVEKRSAGQIVG
jgi:hypothetical protein